MAQRLLTFILALWMVPVLLATGMLAPVHAIIGIEPVRAADDFLTKCLELTGQVGPRGDTAQGRVEALVQLRQKNEARLDDDDVRSDLRKRKELALEIERSMAVTYNELDTYQNLIRDIGISGCGDQESFNQQKASLLSYAEQYNKFPGSSFGSGGLALILQGKDFQVTNLVWTANQADPVAAQCTAFLDGTIPAQLNTATQLIREAETFMKFGKDKRAAEAARIEKGLNDANQAWRVAHGSLREADELGCDEKDAFKQRYTERTEELRTLMDKMNAVNTEFGKSQLSFAAVATRTVENIANAGKQCGCDKAVTGSDPLQKFFLLPLCELNCLIMGSIAELIQSIANLASEENIPYD